MDSEWSKLVTDAEHVLASVTGSLLGTCGCCKCAILTGVLSHFWCLLRPVSGGDIGDFFGVRLNGEKLSLSKFDLDLVAPVSANVDEHVSVSGT